MARALILIADDHAIVRRGLRALIHSQTGWEVCAEASNGHEAVEMALQFTPDVAVLDIGRPVMNGLEATRRVIAAVPHLEVLILTMHQSDEVVREVLRAGARGHVLKSEADQYLIHGIRALLQHKPFLSAELTDTVLSQYLTDRSASRTEPGSRLTGREREIVQLLAEGRSNKEVAALLDISTRTVETHRANIMHKLGMASLGQLVRYAILNKIIEP